MFAMTLICLTNKHHLPCFCCLSLNKSRTFFPSCLISLSFQRIPHIITLSVAANRQKLANSALPSIRPVL